MGFDGTPISSFRVSMRDIDIYGHVHNSVYLDYCEDAVVDYIRHRALLPHFRHTTSGVAYHVKKAEIVFHSPIDVDDVVEASVGIGSIGRTSLTFGIELRRQRDGAHCATAQLVWVCVDLSTNRPAPIPDATREGLAEV
ncbi:acyl-CoA thioesterase [Ochrobactrum sp. XJ1]|nr:acyl-CoA thioesterase [Ochrobactrum sp. XJ1]